MRYLRKFNESLKQEVLDNLNSQEGDSLDLYEIMSEWMDKNNVHHSCHKDLDNFVSYVQSNYDYHIKKS